jgi:hypothetical protein
MRLPSVLGRGPALGCGSACLGPSDIPSSGQSQLLCESFQIFPEPRPTKKEDYYVFKKFNSNCLPTEVMIDSG